MQPSTDSTSYRAHIAQSNCTFKKIVLQFFVQIATACIIQIPVRGRKADLQHN